ncbi:MAG: XRE family transcriptional regulator [Phenylobacterium sp.]|uniref:helix-turn-helix domain-containing protein n=1 Tax=Phenylobacterium sp. TaxID=1871053 RepID=UPI0011F9AF77|nr:helix-turn-helix transcriptional regulator [Phenylobacterium sp.]TAJ72150.1 MAG: XRE family transcriptional regulator [Phenylobacterium sp.]
MIETGDHLRQAREAMGWTPADLARALRFAANHGGSRILEMEAGKRPLTGPVTVAVEALLRGFLPDGFDPPPPPADRR